MKRKHLVIAGLVAATTLAVAVPFTLHHGHHYGHHGGHHGGHHRGGGGMGHHMGKMGKGMHGGMARAEHRQEVVQLLGRHADAATARQARALSEGMESRRETLRRLMEGGGEDRARMRTEYAELRKAGIDFQVLVRNAADANPMLDEALTALRERKGEEWRIMYLLQRSDRSLDKVLEAAGPSATRIEASADRLDELRGEMYDRRKELKKEFKRAARKEGKGRGKGRHGMEGMRGMMADDPELREEMMEMREDMQELHQAHKQFRELVVQVLDGDADLRSELLAKASKGKGRRWGGWKHHRH